MRGMIGKASRYSADAGDCLSDTDVVIKSMDDETDRECSTHRIGKYAYDSFGRKKWRRKPTWETKV